MFPTDTILVVEDDSDQFALIEEGFRRGRIVNEMARARSAEEAVAYFKGTGHFADRERFPLPCLVLLDLKLPGESGFVVLEWLRAQPEFKKLPVVVLTVSSVSGDLEKAYSLGANSYLVKPFNLAEMQALVKSINAYWVLLAQKPRS